MSQDQQQESTTEQSPNASTEQVEVKAEQSVGPLSDAEMQEASGGTITTDSSAGYDLGCLIGNAVYCVTHPSTW